MLLEVLLPNELPSALTLEYSYEGHHKQQANDLITLTFTMRKICETTGFRRPAFSEAILPFCLHTGKYRSMKTHIYS